MILLVPQSRVWPHGGGRHFLSCRLRGCCQIFQHLALLRAQSERDSQHPGNELGAESRLRAEAGSPPDHCWAQGAFRHIIGHNSRQVCAVRAPVDLSPRAAS